MRAIILSALVATSVPGMPALRAAELPRFDTIKGDEAGGILQNAMIWAPGSIDPGTAVAFRKVLRLPDTPGRAVLRIFADARYILWVNGVYVGRGPGRFELNGPEYDCHDLTKYLRRGDNLFAVLAYSTPDGANWKIMKHTPGFCAAMEIAGTNAWTTRDGWRCSTQTRYARILGGGGYADDGTVDLRRECGEWWKPSFSETDWRKPVSVDGSAWGPLTASRIPNLRETAVPITFGNGVQLPVRLTGNDRLKVHAPGVTLGYVRMKLIGSPGTELTVGGCDHSRFILKDGPQEIFTVDARGRNPEFEVAVTSGTATITDFQLIERLYPFDRIGAFECDDPLLNTVWSLGTNTCRLMSEDAYISGARKERSEWMDNSPPCFDVTRVAFAGVNANGDRVNADPRLLEECLRRTGLSLQPNGCVRANTSEDCVDLHSIMEDRACEWIHAFRIDYDATGRTELLREMWPAITAQLDYFIRHKTARGLVNCRDWVAWGNPLAYAHGETTTLNAFVYRALADGAWLGRLIGKDEEAARFDREAVALGRAINAILWDDASKSYFGGYFTDADLANPDRGLKKTRFEDVLRVQNNLCEPTWHANLYMLDRGPVPPERLADTRAAMLRLAPQPTHSIMEYYYYGRQLYTLDAPETDTSVLNFVRRGWKAMATDNKDGTTWESLNGGYHDHPYGMVPAWLLSAYVLGVRWADGIPTNRKLIIEPHPGDLKYAKGVVESEAGPVQVNWKRETGKFEISGRTPIPATLRLLAAAIQINGQQRAGAKNGTRYQYSIPAGDFIAR